MLFDLRFIKYSSVDDSQYIHHLSYNNLHDETFLTLTRDECGRLRMVKRALELLLTQRAVSQHLMFKALGKDNYAEYVQSFDFDMSHVESRNEYEDAMPKLLYEYAEYLKRGDKYTRIANLFQRSKKRDASGRTAFSRYEDKAFGCYEEAVMLITCAVDTNRLCDPSPDIQQANDILRWLDRYVNPQPGFEPDVSIAGVPRIRGSKSKYSQDTMQPVVGQRLRKYWRQREALVQASLHLLYTNEQIIAANELGLAHFGEL